MALRFGLIGVGGYGGSHLGAIENLEATTGTVKLVAVADPFADKLADLHERLTNRGVKWHKDYNDLIDNEQLDAIIIATPIPLHEPMLEAALTRTSARILLEKPPLPTLRQLDRFIALDVERRVRVGFQMIHDPKMRAIKKLLRDGRAGKVHRISISAGWPRGTSYYQRASWAGRMNLNGQPVFDGPATNALSHVFHSAMFLAGEHFATPRDVTAEFYRARNIESYDAAWIRADLGGVELHAIVAHCVKEQTEYRIQVETEKGPITFSQNNFEVTTPPGLEIDTEPTGEMNPLYEDFLQGDQPSTLADTRGYSLLTCGALASSREIHVIPKTDYTEEDGAIDVTGLTSYIEGFLSHRKSPSEAGFSWGRAGQKVDCTAPGGPDLAAWGW